MNQKNFFSIKTKIKFQLNDSSETTMNKGFVLNGI